MIKGSTTKRVEVGEKSKFEGSLGNNNKNKFSKSNTNNNKSGSNQEELWYDQCKKKHFGDRVICYKCKKPGNVSSNSLIK